MSITALPATENSNGGGDNLSGDLPGDGGVDGAGDSGFDQGGFDPGSFDFGDFFSFFLACI
jgi:hypothetical protein